MLVIINIASATPATSPKLFEEVCTVRDFFNEMDSSSCKDSSSMTCLVLVADNLLHGLLVLAGTIQNSITGRREN